MQKYFVYIMANREDVNPQWADLSFDDEQVTPPCRTPRRTSE
jgi:hypothetical protein